MAKFNVSIPVQTSLPEWNADQAHRDFHRTIDELLKELADKTGPADLPPFIGPGFG